MALVNQEKCFKLSEKVRGFGIMTSCQLSSEGLKIVEEARTSRNWNKNQPEWYDKAGVAEPTLKRFLSGKSVRCYNFEALCEAVGVNWEDVVLSRPPLEPPKSNGDWSLNDYLTYGEKSLFIGEQIPAKKKGIEALKNEDYDRAVDSLISARSRNKQDPETLIFKNNALLSRDNAKAYNVAVVAPIKSQPNLSIYLMRGVAQAQDEINSNPNSLVKIRVLLVDDTNDIQRAKELAAKLTRDNQILITIGYTASEILYGVKDIYRRSGLVSISYGSRSTYLTQKNRADINHSFFRTVPTTELTAERLAEYLQSQRKGQRVAVFYNPDNAYSQAYLAQFHAKIEQNEGEILINNFSNLCDAYFDVFKAMQEVNNQEATAIALLPDGIECGPLSYQNALEIIKHAENFTIVAGTGIFSTYETLKAVVSHAENRLVVAAPWHRLSSQNQEFIQTAEELWGEKVLSVDGVNGFTAMCYDATRVVITALEKILEKKLPPSRAEIQRQLVNSDFQAFGASGIIRFDGSDRKEKIQVLLKIVPSNCNQYGYSFVPVDYPLDNDGTLVNCPAKSPCKHCAQEDNV